jgi:hypothetical protein
MKHLLADSLVISTFIVTLSTSIDNGFQTQFKTANTQVQSLVKINFGDQSLDNSGLHAFSECINEKKIDAECRGTEKYDSFEKEPTKNQIKTCNGKVLLGETLLDYDFFDEQGFDFGGL